MSNRPLLKNNTTDRSNCYGNKSDSKVSYKICGSSSSDNEITSINSEPVFNEESSDYFAPLTSLPAVEAAMSIQKIRQRILFYSSPKDLIQFRLISRDWRRDATNDILLKWTKNRIHIEQKSNEGKSDVQFIAESFNGNGKFEKKLQELNDLMNECGSNPFPCSQFLICHKNRKGDEEKLDEFLWNQGSRIKALNAVLININNFHEIPHHDNGINWLVQFVTKLLKQAPNLQELGIAIGATRSQMCNLFNGDEIKICKSDCLRNYNLKLITVSFWSYVPQCIFEFICESVPNLKELTSSNIDYYIEPTNRLYLLKDLKYSPGSKDPKLDKIVERIVNMDNDKEGKLELKELHIYTDNIYSSQKSINLQKVANICNKLLEKSCHSLKKLHLTPVGFLPGLKIPKMSGVKYIYFDGKRRAYPNTKFFPRGIRMSEQFPNLHTIRFNDQFKYVFHGEDPFFIGFEEDIVPSVKVVIKARNHINLHVFQQWFPNARIIDEE